MRRHTLATILLIVWITGCESHPASQPAVPVLTGQFAIDGSSNVYPITALATAAFTERHPDVYVALSRSSSPAGFRLFLAGSTQLCNACRPINAKELAEARQRGIEFLELPIAQDGLVLLVNQDNTWVDHLTVEELRRLWEPASTVKQWSDLRPDWPQRPILLAGPRASSGTFDCLTGALYGREGFCRTDYDVKPQDDDRIRHVAAEPDGLTFCSFGNYATTPATVRLVPIRDGDGPPVLPSLQTIQSSQYHTLLRPFFIYVARDAADRPEINAFIREYLEHAGALARQAGYVPLSDEAYRQVRARFEQRQTGSLFSGQPTHHVTVDAILRSASGRP